MPLYQGKATQMLDSAGIIPERKVTQIGSCSVLKAKGAQFQHLPLLQVETVLAIYTSISGCFIASKVGFANSDFYCS